MDVTSQALRDIEIKEVRRGYDCDAVDDLLEQAAATIDALERRIALAEQHARDSEAQGSNARASEDMLQRTLLLAQRAAEDAVSEATATAAAITTAADSQARATILEATSTAQREANAQRLALETEVRDLTSRRSALSSDVDALERFEADYRERLRRTIAADLDSLAVSREPVAPSARPALHDVGEALAPIAAEPVVAAVAPATPAAPLETAELTAIEVAEIADPAPVVDAPPVLFETTPTPEAMDDDEFFASLREAVNDDTPLGPRDSDIPERSMFGEDRRSGIFRRRR
ncbi:DivIVA protein [Actinobacteria bacterium IMCC26256]|nr:DivIVA protein [Actinobacteria bacterium IMCC26256]